MAPTLLRMNLARCANLSVLKVSLKHAVEGLTLAIMMVLALPPNESCNSGFNAPFVFGGSSCVAAGALEFRARNGQNVCRVGLDKAPTDVQILRKEPLYRSAEWFEMILGSLRGHRSNYFWPDLQ